MAVEPEKLTKAETQVAHVPESWSPDGKALLYRFVTPESQGRRATPRRGNWRTSTSSSLVRGARGQGAGETSLTRADTGERASRVQAARRAQGCAAEVIHVPDNTRTAAKPQRRPLLVLTSGVNRVSTENLRAIVDADVTRPDAEIVRRLTGNAIGGIPPVAPHTPARVLMDRRLLEYGPVWAAAGTPHAVFGISPAALQRVTGTDPCDVTESTRT